ncbi:MAG: copper homeostasis protein CutC [Prevotellaceae bacterium]|jgi:copper homeostasis protein|nr:copper homeostasis protein CutC [Prevotellaceae bacterium]
MSFLLSKKKFILEVCADSLDSAIVAQSSGAHRIELCSNLPEGGTTPSLGLIEAARKLLSIKLYVLIRPRGGDFCYSDTELEIMLSDIRACGKLGCDGVAVGMLNKDGTVDEQRCRRLVEAAHSYGMGVTFHRAFDRCRDLPEAMEAVIRLGCERILTSGGCKNVADGIGTTSELVKKADGRISIMPGAGVTPNNATIVLSVTEANELHGTFRSKYSDNMAYYNLKLGIPDDEYSVLRADGDKIKEVFLSVEESGRFTKFA